MKTLISFIVACFITSASINSIAQDIPLMSKNEKIANKIFKDKSEIIFSFIVNNLEIVNNDLTNIISIDKLELSPSGGYKITAYANKEGFICFLKRNIDYTIIQNKSTKAYTMATTVAQMAGWDRYPTYSVYEQMMAEFATNYPTLCQIDTILNLASGRRILVAQITSNVGTPANKPQFLYSSSMHGDETTGIIMMLRLANLLLTNYGTNTRLTNIVNNIDLWICPIANPDGTYKTSNNTIGSSPTSTRYNANSKDLNRNYPDPRIGGPENSEDPDVNAPRQPETQAFMDFASAHHFNMAANFHGGTDCVNYPWDTWSSSRPTSDNDWWYYVSKHFADSCRLYGSSISYFNGPGLMANYTNNTTGVTHGGDWYIITGGRQDYMNYFHHCKEVTLEISDTKTLGTEKLNDYWGYLYRPILKYLEHSLYGVRGVITDSCTGLPMKAKVFVNSHDVDSSHVYSSVPVGNYHRYLKAGTYSITYSATGYQSKTYTNIVVTDGQATIKNVTLKQTPPVAAFIADATTTCTGLVNFTNQSSSSATSWSWNFGDGGTSSLQNPSHTYTSNGTYTVKLKVTSCAGKDSIIKTSYINVNLPASPSVTPGSRCGSGTVNLAANGTGTLNWYDAATGGSMVNTGTNFTTPSLSSTTTYYVENNPFTIDYVGKTDSIGGGAFFTANNTYYLIFNCTSSVVLKSVKIYAGSAGNRTIELRNSSNTLLQSLTVPVTAGESRVTLNFNIPVGTGLRLKCNDANPNMYRSSGGITYPYTLAGKISITGTNASTTRYYYFYDWEIVSPSTCISTRVPVTATINNFPIAAFTNNVVNNTANFTNTSSFGTTYLWDFGDGSTNTGQNPSHTYTSNGTYNVKLKVTNACGSDSVIHQVTITTVGISDIENGILGVNIFPNPSTGNINLSIFSAQGDNCTLLIYNILGECLYREYFGLSAGNTTHSLNLEALGKGLYYLKLDFNNNSYIQKIVIR